MHKPAVSLFELVAANFRAGVAMEPPVRDFKFPFRPYESQSAFMNRLYEQVNAGGVAIFESPTGTVRSCNSSR